MHLVGSTHITAPHSASAAPAAARNARGISVPLRVAYRVGRVPGVRIGEQVAGSAARAMADMANMRNILGR